MILLLFRSTFSRMSHQRRAVGNAVLLNTAISAVEAIAGFQAHSLSVLTDSVHNLSDENAKEPRISRVPDHHK